RIETKVEAESTSTCTKGLGAIQPIRIHTLNSGRKAALSMGEKTAVILDRHPLWLEALERLLDGVGVRVIGKTTSAGEALDIVEESNPGVFIVEDDSLARLPDGLST